MNSFWEKDYKSQTFDFSIIGAGFTGLFSALFLKEKYPEARIIIIDRSYPPMGASTKNAGFACFGSISEILDDLDNEPEDQVFKRVSERFEGINLIKTYFASKSIDYKNLGGYEIFKNDDSNTYSKCIENIHPINEKLKAAFDQDVFRETPNKFGFNTSHQLIYNSIEGQLNPYKLWLELYQNLSAKNVYFQTDLIDTIDFGSTTTFFSDSSTYKATNAIIATNAFARKLLKEENIFPRRGQVMITKPLSGLKIKGTFHFDKGYVYFRNVGDRILIGGGRNIDSITENTDEFQNTNRITDYLKGILENVILPDYNFEIEHQWSGIMGFGANNEKDYILKPINKNAVQAIRLGGMGVALSPILARKMIENYF